ncbi:MULTISPECIES: NAD-dependent succinate-semialdehyde dehydrogenase [unclassified Mycobacterium]|uniref:NAD-dependent succinate-semialdehyde dehydrogenase n=1 Tax=unclassified Mycobacterium TaxID=2642494 RepID=UPI0007FC9B96|nr:MULTISPECIES: NAD-dependent succinate-semialdehyde dehydrogenase [unclassified Mycobacterium]OBI11854.1 NAD-dependent succinate-semialdehyde dehydrogenase [Mycobacterium sp. E2497]
MATITPAQERSVIDAVPKQLFIGGSWQNGQHGTFTVEDPATAQPLCEVADATAEDAISALDAAVDAAPSFAASAPRERAEILRRAFELIVARIDDLALINTLEMGKPVKEAKAEILYAAEFFRWFSEEAVRIDGRYSRHTDGGGRVLTLRQPVGPCLMITPWNFPLAMGTRKIGPAIAAGCTMIIKPAEQTPLSILALAAILHEAGLPGGVLNVVSTLSAPEVLAPVINDPRLRKLSFTGSTPVGRALVKQSADQLLRVSMELGGNAPFIVFEDADVDAAVDGAMVAKMRNNGEACVAANRFHLSDKIAAEFIDKLTARMSALRIGRGTEDNVDMGPLIDAAQLKTTSGLVSDAIERGAEAVIGGKAPEGPGYFYEPTVLANIPSDAPLRQSELFGPVAPIFTFSDEEQAIADGNDTEYGLVSYLYTNDLKRALRVSEALQTGMVGLNQGLVSNPQAPFGGVKQSGFGREGGYEGIDEYVEDKYIAINL